MNARPRFVSNEGAIPRPARAARAGSYAERRRTWPAGLGRCLRVLGAVVLLGAALPALAAPAQPVTRPAPHTEHQITGGKPHGSDIGDHQGGVQPRGDCGTDQITQSNNPNAIGPDSVWCGSLAVSAETSLARAFVAPSTIDLRCVTFGIRQNMGGDWTAHVRILLGDVGAPYDQLTLLQEMDVNVPGGTTFAFFTAMFDGVVIPAGTSFVVELNSPSRDPADGGDGGLLAFGCNAQGQTAPTYLRAPACDVPNFVTLESVGFGSRCLVMTLGVQIPNLTTGTLVCSDGTPLSNCTVQLDYYDSAGLVGSVTTTTDANGFFSTIASCPNSNQQNERFVVSSPCCRNTWVIPDTCCCGDLGTLTCDDCCPAGDCCPENDTCPPGAVTELEPCGFSLNDTCGSLFEAPLACQATVCGSFWFDGVTHDIDYFPVSLSTSQILTWSVHADVPVDIQILNQQCNVVSGAQSGDCPVTVTSECLPAGIYFVSVTPAANAPPIACGDPNGDDRYVANLSCTPCDLPPPVGPCMDPVETITLRSGQVLSMPSGPLVPGSPGQLDATIVYTTAGPMNSCFNDSLDMGSGLPFFAACFSTTPAQVIAPVSVWAPSLPGDPNARWINWIADPNQGNWGVPSHSVLYCHPFTVSSAMIGQAYLTFLWAVDDSLGDPSGGPAPVGVYLRNGSNVITPLPVLSGGSYAFQTGPVVIPIPSGAITPGANDLIVYQRDLGCAVSGVIYSATIEICDTCQTFNDPADGVEGWQGAAPGGGVTISYVPGGGPAGDGCLQVHDEPSPPASVAFNAVRFPKDWASIACECEAEGHHATLEFDVRLVDDGLPSQTLNINPRIFLRQDTDGDAGNNPSGVTAGADFFATSYTINENSGWIHIVAPLPCSDSMPGSLTNSYGSWTVSSGTWAGLLANVTYIQLPVELAAGQETWQWDNICIHCDRCVPPPANLGLWLPFDENMTGIAHNPPGAANGMDNQGTGGVFTGPGMVGNARCFDQGYVQVPNYPAIGSLPAGSDFTIDAWIRTNTTSGNQTIVDKTGMFPGITRGYWFYLAGGVLHLQLADPSGAPTTYNSTLPVSAGVWHFVSVSVDRVPGGPATAGTVTFVVDGSPPDVASLAANLEPGPIVTGIPVPFRVACRSFALQDFFYGCIDEVEFMRRAVPWNELHGLYVAASMGKCKRFCDVPWDRAFWRTDLATITVPVTICNAGADANFNFAFNGLNAGAMGLPSSCTVPGPTSFTANPPSPVFIPGGSCVTINVTMNRPPFVHFDDVGCYKLDVWPDDGSPGTSCIGSLWDSRGLCFDGPVTGDGFIPVEPNFAIDLGGVTVTNTNDTPASVPYRISVLSPDKVPDLENVGLNGLPPGEPVLGTLDLAPQGVAVVPISIIPRFLDPWRPYSILIEADTTQSGIFTPVGSASLIFIAAATGCTADFNGDGTVNSQDFFDFLSAFFGLQDSADFNGDGVINSQDFFDFITAFFAGC